MDVRTQVLLAERDALWRRPGPFGPGRRQAYTALIDDWLRGLVAEATTGTDALALVAVGGYGRGALAPGSDLDVLLLHADGADVSVVADRVWYPIWDSGLRLDHSVRTIDQALSAARDDLKVAVGLLDVRHIAGHVALTASLREKALAGWRASAPHRLPELRASAARRAERAGELSYLLEPDLKESYGGLREATTLRAITASWLADAPRGSAMEANEFLLNVRDALHVHAGRAQDRLGFQVQGAVAAALGMSTSDDLLRAVCGAGRTLAFACDTAWHRVERATPRKRPVLSFRDRRPTHALRRAPLAEGVVHAEGEVFLAREADPALDPALGLRAAAAAAQAGLRLAPVTVDRIAASNGDLPRPWSSEVRESFVSLLGAGTAAVPVWEALDQARLWDRWLPGWERLRALPQHNPVHRFTVDRHLVEAAVQASALSRRVARPDLLLVGALLHDVGKGLPGDHSERGVELVKEWAPAMGFDDHDVDTLVRLCQWHLLLPDTATRRDHEDPATTDAVAQTVGTHEFLDLLHALTEADARATGPLAWTDWRASLIADLVQRTHQVMRGAPRDPTPILDPAQRAWALQPGLGVQVERSGPAWTVTVAADDRPGLLAAVAGVLSLHRLGVRSAALVSEQDRAVQVWTVQPDFGDAPSAEALRADLQRVLEGTVDLEQRLRAREQSYARPAIQAPDPTVTVVAHASDTSTVLEVRAHDELALLHRIGRVLAATGVDVRSARVSTMGSEAVDVFYVVAREGGPLDLPSATRVAEQVRLALT